jgi:hypothetical protein
MGERRGVDRALMGRPEDKRQTVRLWRRWENTVKMDLKGIGWEGVEWILLAQIRDRRCL